MKNVVENHILGDHFTDKELARYVDASNSGNLHLLPEEMLNHIETCLDCKMSTIELLELIDFNDEDDIVQINQYTPKQSKHTPFIPKALIIVAAASVVAIVIYGFLKFEFADVKSNNNSKKLVDNKLDTISFLKENVEIDDYHQISENKIKPDPQVNSSDRFDEFIIFETAINNNYRSATDRKLFTPVLDAELTNVDSIEFKWETTDIETQKFYLYDNKGKVIYSEENILNGHCLVAIMLAEALYYWKVENENDIILIGKFYILIQ
jgi:hypothetical protein